MLKRRLREEQDEWQRLLSLWQDRKMAFGSATRNGLGRIRWLLVKSVTLTSLKARPKPSQFVTVLTDQCQPNVNYLNLNNPVLKRWLISELKADDVWRCGRGTALLTDQPYEHSIAAVTYSEPRLQWQQNQVIIKKKSSRCCVVVA